MVRTLKDSNLDDNDRKLLQDVDEFGWHVVIVPDEGSTPGWAFSVGLYHNYKHPEVIVFGLPLELLHAVVNVVGDEVKSGTRFKDGSDYPDILEGVRCMFRGVDNQWYRPFLGYAGWFYRGDGFPVMQCIWPDKKQRYPWYSGFNAAWLSKQPLLYEKEAVAARAVELLRTTGDWVFPDPPNVATFTTRQVVVDGKPILFVTHDADDGAWQFHSGDDAQASDAMLVGLGQMLRHDRSLAELADLPVGWKATRSAVGQPWRRTKGK
jgi:hypothetical protein